MDPAKKKEKKNQWSTPKVNRVNGQSQHLRSRVNSLTSGDDVGANVSSQILQVKNFILLAIEFYSSKGTILKLAEKSKLVTSPPAVAIMRFQEFLLETTDI